VATSVDAPRVGIVIVNYKGRDDTLECLASLERLAYAPVDVVLVDQASGDGTPAAVRERFPDVHVVENPVNNGFAGGNNVGIREALSRGADYLFLLNNDTVVDPDVLGPLVALSEMDPSVGVVGPKMLYHGQPNTVWAAGGRIDASGNSMLLDEGTPDTPGGEPRDVDFVVGCGLLVRRDVLEKIGLLDERFFLYYEESDLCARARGAGYRVVSHPGARLWHKVSRSTGADSEVTLYYMRRNVLLYLARHGTRAGRTRALADSLRLALVWTAQGKHRRRRVLLRAVGDYVRGNFGKAKVALS
jgi:hypothetical protein